ncbi:hypothetical protein [Rhodopila sp.]|uniref:hypothetical protein n=1 Tax=Rhodopila sp. TaxID=2480087 RepID=UPI003D115BA5
MATPEKAEWKRDKALKDSFPASDAPANSGTTGAEKPDKPSHQRDIEEQPTGMPTSDRHATETAHQWEHEEKPKPKR